MATILADIQVHGVDGKAGFADGWMCLIYKKKDPTKICNH